jgi:hypothetical protein
LFIVARQGDVEEEEAEGDCCSSFGANTLADSDTHTGTSVARRSFSAGKRETKDDAEEAHIHRTASWENKRG